MYSAGFYRDVVNFYLFLQWCLFLGILTHCKKVNPFLFYWMKIEIDSLEFGIVTKFDDDDNVDFWFNFGISFICVMIIISSSLSESLLFLYSALYDKLNII